MWASDQGTSQLLDFFTFDWEYLRILIDFLIPKIHRNSQGVLRIFLGILWKTSESLYERVEFFTLVSPMRPMMFIFPIYWFACEKKLKVDIHAYTSISVLDNRIFFNKKKKTQNMMQLVYVHRKRSSCLFSAIVFSCCFFLLFFKFQFLCNAHEKWQNLVLSCGKIHFFALDFLELIFRRRLPFFFCIVLILMRFF